MRALEATYKDQRFRSRLEAKWCIFWDALAVRWEYEPEALELDGFAYIPDFWLPDYKVWVEIKGTIHNDEAGGQMVLKASELARQSSRPVILCFHEPYDPKCAVFTNRGMYSDSRWTICALCGGLALGVKGDSFSCVWCPRRHDTTPLTFSELRTARRSLYNAAVAARQHRFGVSHATTLF